MSIRRSLALAGAAALASSLVLAGAQGAMAVGVTGTPSAAAPAEKASHQALDLSVHGVPGTFIAGGDAREFTYRIDNSTKTDFVAFPLLKFKNKAGTLKAKDLKLEYQLPASLPGGGTWKTAVIAPGGGDGDDSAVLMFLGDVTADGDAADGALLYLAQGKSVDIKVRASFTKDTPLGKAGVVPVVYSADVNDENDHGGFSCDGIKGAGFTIKAGGGKPTPTPTPTKTGKPSPTASSSPTASHTPTSSASPTAPATATATATSTPTTEPTKPTAEPTTPTTAPTAPATGTGSPSASPSDSGATGAPVPSGDSTTDAPQPIDFPVQNPTVTPPKITPSGVTKAKTAAATADKSLATTGGGDHTTAIAATGGAVLVAGVGTLVVLRRRKSGQQS
ncbi:LPXTG cell wall anchor domain-containing protein [Kitasatospora sp. NPDC058190]|uniref:LPXTG cell wall anchor domain-containing protein n=1 Tax=Kitasatospora sp. NPDC058190 TaxID=3346371 RepID=UPI0036D829E2